MRGPDCSLTSLNLVFSNNSFKEVLSVSDMLRICMVNAGEVVIQDALLGILRGGYV